MTYLSMAYLLLDVVHALARGKVWWDLPRHALAILCFVLPVLSQLLLKQMKVSILEEQ